MSHIDSGRFGRPPVRYLVLSLHPAYRDNTLPMLTFERLLGERHYVAGTVLESMDDYYGWINITRNGLEMMMDDLNEAHDVDRQEIAYRWATWQADWFQLLLHNFYDDHRAHFEQLLGNIHAYEYSYADRRGCAIVVEVSPRFQG